MQTSRQAMPASEIKEKIIVALDFDTTDEARRVVSELNGEVGAFKIGLQLFVAGGNEFVRELTGAGHKVFLDLKFHDIPNTVAKAAVEAARLGVWMFNVHALGGSEMLRRTHAEVGEVCDKEKLPQPLIIAVTVLTSTNAEGLKDVGLVCDLESEVLNLATLAANAGLDGVVASARETRLIRQNISRNDFLIITPGIRADFATNDDQKRVMTPGGAIRNGSDYLVIGRPITQAENRSAAVHKIISEIELST